MSDKTIKKKGAMNKTYIVATTKPWNIATYEMIIKHYPGNWHLVTSAKELTVELVQKLEPRYIFFPHWNSIVPSEILAIVECVCFHETDLPYGRGGSPIQNLIKRGHVKTVITALRMTNKIDAGPIYMKRKLLLEGTAEEIFTRASDVVAKMILEIIKINPIPMPQKGRVVVFKRRTPDQSEIFLDMKSLKELFDHIRMLDADGYPKAFIKYGCFRIEFSKPTLLADAIEASIHITKVTQRR